MNKHPSLPGVLGNEDRVALYEIMGPPLVGRLRRTGLRSSQMKQLQDRFGQVRGSSKLANSVPHGPPTMHVRQESARTRRHPESQSHHRCANTRTAPPQNGAASARSPSVSSRLRELERAISALGKSDWNDRAVVEPFLVQIIV